MAERAADTPAVLEQFPYRARKWAFQQLTPSSGADQDQRIGDGGWDVSSYWMAVDSISPGTSRAGR